MVIFFLGDSGLETLAWLGEMKIYMVAAAVALVSIPFVVSQLDGLSRHEGSSILPMPGLCGDLRVAVFT